MKKNMLHELMKEDERINVEKKYSSIKIDDGTIDERTFITN